VENICQIIWFGGKYLLPLQPIMKIVGKNWMGKIVDNFHKKNLDIPNLCPTFVPMLKLKSISYALTVS
jgi:hypothetical protein